MSFNEQFSKHAERTVKENQEWLMDVGKKAGEPGSLFF